MQKTLEVNWLLIAKIKYFIPWIWEIFVYSLLTMLRISLSPWRFLFSLIVTFMWAIVELLILKFRSGTSSSWKYLLMYLQFEMLCLVLSFHPTVQLCNLENYCLGGKHSFHMNHLTAYGNKYWLGNDMF